MRLQLCHFVLKKNALQIHLHVHVGIKLYTDLLFNVNNNVRFLRYQVQSRLL